MAAVVSLAALFFSSSATAATSVTSFNKVTYTNQTSVANAAKYQFVVMGDGSGPVSQAAIASLIASIHQNDPQSRVLLYKNAVASPKDTTGIQGCAAWNPSLPSGGIPASWFLKSPSGAPLYNSQYGLYELDPGNPQVQQACVASAVSFAKRGGYDGVFWDSISSSLFWANLSPSTCGSQSCSSNAAWDTAEASYVSNISAGLHAQKLLSIGNIAGGAMNWCCGGGPAYWQSLQLAGLDGAAEESFTSGTNHLPVSTNQWKLGLANEAWNEANGKYFLANGDVTGNRALNVYGLATLLLAAGGRSSWDTASGNYYSGEYWFPEYDTALALGAPLGPYSVQANGLYVRKFQNGGVVVNPNATAVPDPLYGTLAAHSGLILGPGLPAPGHRPTGSPGTPRVGSAASTAGAPGAQGGTRRGRGASHRARGKHRHRHRHRKHLAHRHVPGRLWWLRP
ncbi:MAG: putative glycoside hydrolase family 15 protein [Actinomycetota bacterium]|nr:putative glycoside hydrolase family 15 protein [Actinomycetota bacterium]